MFREARSAGLKDTLGRVGATRLNQRQPERVVRLCMVGIERNGLSQRCDCLVGTSPTQQPAPQYAMGPCTSGRKLDGSAVVLLGEIVATHDLVCVPEVHAQSRLTWRNGACPCKSRDGALPIAFTDLRSTEVDPVIELFGPGADRPAELAHRKPIGAFVKRAATTKGGWMHARRADRDQHARECLTQSPRAATIPAMTRDVLQAILRAATGLTEKGNAFRVANEHRVTLYLGSDNGSIAVQEVSAVTLHDAFVEVAAHDPGKIYTGYDAVQALSVKPPKEASSKQAGFA